MMNAIHCFVDEFKNYELYSVVGNHEYYTDLSNASAGRPTDGQLYNGLIKRNEKYGIEFGALDTYWFDNKTQKTRYFMVSCGRDTETTKEQIKWVCNELTKVPTGYRIILVGHSLLNDTLTAFRGDNLVIANALDAVKAKTSITYDGVSYDYSMVNADVVAMITGHSHMDGVFATNGGIKCICTKCDCWSRECQNVDGVATTVPRVNTGINGQAFDVVQIDYSHRKIYCTRIGSGSDREFTY